MCANQGRYVYMYSNGPQNHEKWRYQFLKIWVVICKIWNICRFLVPIVYIYLIPETSIFYWRFQLDGSKSLHQQMECFHSISPPNEVGFDCHFTASQRERGGKKNLLWVSKCVFLSNEICDFMPFWSKTRRQSSYSQMMIGVWNHLRNV